MTENRVRLVSGRLCRLKRYLFTCAIEVGVLDDHHDGRYCYETVEQAQAAFDTWDGTEHPPGKWIKFKSARLELLNPGWTSSQ